MEFITINHMFISYNKISHIHILCACSSKDVDKEFFNTSDKKAMRNLSNHYSL